jgi:hypothetical protein
MKFHVLDTKLHGILLVHSFDANSKVNIGVSLNTSVPDTGMIETEENAASSKLSTSSAY